MVVQSKWDFGQSCRYFSVGITLWPTLFRGAAVIFLMLKGTWDWSTEY